MKKWYFSILFVICLITIFNKTNSIGIEDYADLDPRMEKYFSREFQDKLKEERAKKASSTSGDIDLELSEE